MLSTSCRTALTPRMPRAARLVAFQREALADAVGLDEAFGILGDATLAHVLAASPLSQEAEAALPERVQELLRKARRGIN
jgi:hypothetical protein